MSYHQVLNIGEDAIKVVVEYDMNDDTYAVVNKIIYEGREIPVGMFDLRQIESIAETLEAGHAAVLRELDWEHKADMAADREAFRAAYGD